MDAGVYDTSNPLGARLPPDATAQSRSAVSWAAILAGSAGAAVLSLLLMILGSGLGLSSVSPWSGQGISAEGIGVAAIVWITFTQLASAAIGGYLAGRLRTRWVSVHGDEVYFRDTAHGFLAWAFATLVMFGLMATSVGSLLGTGVQAGSNLVAGAASSATEGVAAIAGPASPGGAAPRSDNNRIMGYTLDTLFRPAASSGGSSPATSAPPLAEVGRIFTNALAAGSMAPSDVTYVGQLVASRTGLSQADAEKRVSDTFTQAQTTLRNADARARDAADKARKATAYAMLWMFVALLLGAFTASWCATYGGRRRDL